MKRPDWTDDVDWGVLTFGTLTAVCCIWLVALVLSGIGTASSELREVDYGTLVCLERDGALLDDTCQAKR